MAVDVFLDTATNSPPAIGNAMDALVLLAIASFAVGLVLALFDGGMRMSEPTQRRIGRSAAGALVLLTVGAVAGGLIVAGNPVTLVRDKAKEFKQLDTAAPGETRLGSTSGQRYDLWRIALDEFDSAPLTGVGEGSYPQRYYVERKTDRNLSTPHSLPMAVLAETGLVGLLLLLALPVAAVVAVVAVARGWGALPAAARRPASALLASAAVLLGQSTVDWLWQIPAMAGLGLTCLALGVAVVSTPDTPDPPPAGGCRCASPACWSRCSRRSRSARSTSRTSTSGSPGQRGRAHGIRSSLPPAAPSASTRSRCRRATSRRARWSRSAAARPPAASCWRRSTASRRTS